MKNSTINEINWKSTPKFS